jgi:hypothetical protein
MLQRLELNNFVEIECFSTISVEIQKLLVKRESKLDAPECDGGLFTECLSDLVIFR